MNEFLASRAKAYAYTGDEWSDEKEWVENNEMKKLQCFTEITGEKT